MTARRIDRTLLGLGALLILISSYQLFFKRAQSEEGFTLGRLTSTLSVVKTKNALSLDWRDALSGNELTENQLIYTDHKSSAEVSFIEGGSLEIGENSLIKLTSGKEQGMDVERGFIRAKLKASSPLRVQINGEEILVSGQDADIQINLAGEKGEIGVLKGEVKIEATGIVQNLTSQSALSIDQNKFTKKNIYFTSSRPVSGEVRYVASLPASVDFSWSPIEKASIQISGQASMDNPIIYEGLPQKIDLAEGLYYYKIENEKGASLVSPFRVIKEVAPDILRPLDGEEISLREGKESVLLQWRDEAKLRYEIEYDDGLELQRIEKKGSSALLEIKKEGRVTWRIRILDEKRPLAVWSKWQKFNTILVRNPQVPQELSPHEVEFQTYEAPNEKVELKWKGADLVELQIIDPAGTMLENKIIGSSFEYFAKSGGAYRWRVRALDNFLRVSEWSEWKNFFVEDLSNVKDSSGVQRIQLKRPDQAVTFDWRSEAGAVSVFELAKDSQFKNIVKKVNVTKNSIQVSVPEIGAYYWRSRQFLPDGTINSSEPLRVIIEPVPGPLKPEKLPDIELPLEEMPERKTSFWDFIIPSAYADDEMKGIARITLPTQEDAKAYVVRIYRDKDLQNLAYEIELDTKELTWKYATPGTYYWQYAVVDFWDRRSEFSDPATLTLKEHPFPRPEKAKLIFPIRKVALKRKELQFKWTSSELNKKYKIEISDRRDFKNILFQGEQIGSELDLSELKIDHGEYYWRVTSFNKKNDSIISNTGRFDFHPELERIVIADPVAWEKNWKSRALLGWSPSMDSYSFKKNGISGKIDGNALMGASLSGTHFTDRITYSGEILRQTGKVFKKEEYLFQRILFDVIYTKSFSLNHRWGLGAVIAQTSAQTYSIESGKVWGKAESGLNYGLVLRDFWSFNQVWETQSKIFYLAGDITQIEISFDALKHQKDFFFLGGVGFSSRSYSKSSGEQTSMKISLGLGKEF